MDNPPDIIGPFDYRMNICGPTCPRNFPWLGNPLGTKNLGHEVRKKKTPSRRRKYWGYQLPKWLVCLHVNKKAFCNHLSLTNGVFSFVKLRGVYACVSFIVCVLGWTVTHKSTRKLQFFFQYTPKMLLGGLEIMTKCVGYEAPSPSIYQHW